jgi:heptosyltransferase II
MKRVLIIQTASIGDVILVTPVIEAVHQHDPDIRIDLLVKQGMENLFRNHPFLNKILLWNKADRKYRNLFRLIINIRKQQYDAVINVQRFFSSGLVTMFSGAKTTAGFSKNPLSAAFTHRIDHNIGDPAVHEVDRNSALLKPLGIVAKPTIKLYPSEEDFNFVNNLKGVPYLCFAPASLWFTKQFPEEKWIELLDKIPHDYKCYLLGSQSDSQMATNIRNKTSHSDVIILTGQLTLLQTAALMKDAIMNYCNDSAPLHLASSVNAPVTAIFCSTVPAFGFGPRSDDARIVETDVALDCRPCGIHGLKKCPESHFKCALTININKLISNIPA